MDCLCFSLLLGYSVTVSIALTILISLYTTCGSIEETQEVVSGDQQKTVIEKFDILSFDNSELIDKAGDSCNCFEALGFTILEILVMTILAFGVRMGTYLKKKLLKKREAIRLSKEQKALEMRRKIEQEIKLTAATSRWRWISWDWSGDRQRMRRKNTWRETRVPLILDYADTEMIKLEEMFGTCTWKNLNIQNLIINFRSRRWGSSLTIYARLTVRPCPH